MPRSTIPAVTHVDGTARVQVLDRSMCPLLYDLLWAYAQRSGLPILLNTSFNLAGEPIVNRAAEGYSTFRRSGIDALVAGGLVIDGSGVVGQVTSVGTFSSEVTLVTEKDQSVPVMVSSR